MIAAAPATRVDGASRLRDVPGVLIQGRLDVSGPAATAWQLHKRWPASTFVLADDEGHGGPRMVHAIARFASRKTPHRVGPAALGPVSSGHG